MRRQLSTTVSRYGLRSVDRLSTPWSVSALDAFRDQFFGPQLPAVFAAESALGYLPAIERWFTPAHNNHDGEVTAAKPRRTGTELMLNHSYLERYGDTMVPLELTRPRPGPSTAFNQTTDEQDRDRESFKRFYAPLSLFLQWSRTVESQTPRPVQNPGDTPTGSEQEDRLYLAQCQLSDLPLQLRDDLPTPQIVAKAGRGDIYDTNIWIGMPPTYTPLHRDPNPNLFVQLAGSKLVRLYTPEVGQGVFAHVRARLGRGGGRQAAAFRGEEMMRSTESELLEREVWGDSAVGPDQEAAYEARLDAGDALFIPKGWWHSIKGVGEGVTASVNWWFR